MTTTTSASPQTLADSAPQLIRHDPPYTYRVVFNGIALPDPASLPPSATKRRIRADRRLLSELGRTANSSKRRSTHKAMAKRIFFLLSGRHRLQKSVPPSYEAVRQLDKKKSPSRYRLPSFRDGFSDCVPDTGHLDSMRSAVAPSRLPGRQGGAGLQLPSVYTLLGKEWC